MITTGMLLFGLLFFLYNIFYIFKRGKGWTENITRQSKVIPLLQQ